MSEWGPQVIDGLDEQSFIGIDDIDAIAKNREWEEAIFHLYNRVRDNEQTTLIITSKYPPTATSLLLPDLTSRLSWCLVIQIQELNDLDKILIKKDFLVSQKAELSLEKNIVSENKIQISNEGCYLIN